MEEAELVSSLVVPFEAVLGGDLEIERTQTVGEISPREIAPLLLKPAEHDDFDPEHRVRAHPRPEAAAAKGQAGSGPAAGADTGRTESSRPARSDRGSPSRRAAAFRSGLFRAGPERPNAAAPDLSPARRAASRDLAAPDRQPSTKPLATFQTARSLTDRLGSKARRGGVAPRLPARPQAAALEAGDATAPAGAACASNPREIIRLALYRTTAQVRTGRPRGLGRVRPNRT